MRINNNSKTNEIKKVINQLEEIVNVIEKHKNAYFWAPALKAEERRKTEFNDEYQFQIFDDYIEIEITRENSCKNVYFRRKIYFNGKKSNVTKIKNILKKLKTILATTDGSRMLSGECA